jgi:hypothetical protein
MYNHMDGYTSQEIIPDNTFDHAFSSPFLWCGTIFDHAGEEITFYLGLFMTVTNTSGRLEEFADALMVTMQLPCNL